jgi:hypothetical protein
MCGRSTYRLTWEEIVRLYRLTLNQPARNTQARYNVCPTDPVDTIVARGDGERELVSMRWGLVPRWWSKSLKEVKMAMFNARAETVETKPFFRDAFKRTQCLIPVSGYYEWQDTPSGKQPWYFTARDGRLREKLLERIEGIVRESVKPLEKIEGIKILHVDGINGGSSGRNVTDEVIDSALRYRVQAPMIDSLMKELGIEGGGLGRMTDVLRDAKDISALACDGKTGKEKPAKANKGERDRDS